MQKIRSSSSLFLLLTFLYALSSQAWAEIGRFAPMNPEFLNFQHASATQEASDTDNRLLGERPSPLDLSHVLPPSRNDSRALSTTSLPARYDLREHDAVTPVRDQGPYGTCWAFGTFASLESTLRRSGTDDFDFSEWHLAYFAYVDESDSLPSFTAREPEFGMDPIFDQGGNNWKATAILARWTGAVNETDRPYPALRPWPESSRPLPSDPPSMRLKHVHHLGAEFNPDVIKRTVLQHGSVRIRVVWSNEAYSPETASFFNPAKTGGGHAVNIIGWDDGYPAASFNTNPGRAGAWIVQNSWGSDWGENGYFHISYAEPTIGTPSLYIGGTTNEFERIYQYDPLGWTGEFGYGSDTAWFANIFTAHGPAGESRTQEREVVELLRAVSFYAAQANSPYQIEVRRGVGENAPGSGSLAHTASGVLTAAGYHTVALAAPVPLTAGERFSVAVRLTTPGYLFPVPVEKPIDGYSDKATAAPGESFASFDGRSWMDMTERSPNTNVCLKAFTSTGTTPLPTSGGGGCIVAWTGPPAPVFFLLLPLLAASLKR